MNARSVAGRVVAEQLAHPRAHERGDQQHVGLVGHAGQARTVAQRLDAARAEEHHRLAHRADPLRAGEQRGVGEAQQLVAEADVAHDRALDLLELDARLQVGELRQARRGAASGSARPGTISGSARNAPWKAAKPSSRQSARSAGVSTEVAMRTRSRPRSAATRARRPSAPWAARSSLTPQATSSSGSIAGPKATPSRTMHAPRSASWWTASKSASSCALDRRHLEHDAVGADRHRPDAEQQLAAERQPRDVAARERVEADLGEGVDDDRRAVDEQLVAEQARVAVENGLARHRDLAGGRLGRRRAGGSASRPRVIVRAGPSLSGGAVPTAGVRGSLHDQRNVDRVALRPAYVNFEEERNEHRSGLHHREW